MKMTDMITAKLNVKSLLNEDICAFLNAYETGFMDPGKICEIYMPGATERFDAEEIAEMVWTEARNRKLNKIEFQSMFIGDAIKFPTGNWCIAESYLNGTVKMTLPCTTLGAYVCLTKVDGKPAEIYSC